MGEYDKRFLFGAFITIFYVRTRPDVTILNFNSNGPQQRTNTNVDFTSFYINIYIYIYIERGNLCIISQLCTDQCDIINAINISQPSECPQSHPAVVVAC